MELTKKDYMSAVREKAGVLRRKARHPSFMSKMVLPATGKFLILSAVFVRVHCDLRFEAGVATRRYSKQAYCARVLLEYYTYALRKCKGAWYACAHSSERTVRNSTMIMRTLARYAVGQNITAIA